jgi:hypothetical protein
MKPDDALTQRSPRPYHVALSFAGEDRPFVEEVARCLKGRGVRVFYDRYERVSFWGKNLYDHLREVYQFQATYTVIFVSSDYAKKLWTNHERESAQARAFKESREYILPVKFDDTKIPGLLDTTGYVSAKECTPKQICDLIIEKLNATGGIDLLPRHMQTTARQNNPEYAMFQFRRLVAEKIESVGILIDPLRYSCLGEMLNDLYAYYLAQYFPAFTYGSNWVVTDSGRFGFQILVPCSWISRHAPIHELDPEWLISGTLDIRGIYPGHEYRIVDLTTDHDIFDGLCAVASNDKTLIDLMAAEPKGVGMLLSYGCLDRADLHDIDVTNYKYVRVFHDWMSVRKEHTLLVETGKDISEVKSVFRRFRE